MKYSSIISTCIFIFLLIVHLVSSAINWNGNWAFSCDFKGNDLKNVQSRGEDCARKCNQTSGCTHFTWTTFNTGTCWMKQGKISKDQAHDSDDKEMVCGVVEHGLPKHNLGPILSNVLATRHPGNEPGACELPSMNYAVNYPVALGNIESLKHLKYRAELCGQILNVNCGHGALNIIITNSNLGGGLDLYASTWSKLTNNKPPGESSCSVKLTSLNAFNFNGPRCFYKPESDFNNPYYHNVGLLNTNGRLVIKASINNQFGEHRGPNPYYAFNQGRPIDKNEQVIFTFDDGTTHSVFLRDCQQEKIKYWN
jgi:hypothetical protein